VKGLAIAFRDELRTLRCDPGALLVLVGAIVLYSFFYPLPYLHEVLKEVPVAVVDLDHGALARTLEQMVDAHELLRVAAHPASLAEAEQLVARGECVGILAIPAGFERDVRRGRQAEVAVYADASYFLAYRQALTGLVESTGTLSAGVELLRLRASGLGDRQAHAARDPLPLVTRSLFNPTEGYASYVVPSVMLLILQQTLLVGLGMLGGTAREKGQRRGAEVAPLARVLGRAAVYLALYAVHAVYYLVLVPLLYGFPRRGEPAALALFMLPFLLAIIFLGLAVAPVFTRRESSIQVLLFTSLPAVFLAGFSWPIEAIPPGLRAASFLLPSTAGIAGVLRLNAMGASLRHVRFELLVLWALTICYLLLAWWSEWRIARAGLTPPRI
jgi:ABC-2 type transport system permease protein